LKLHGLPLAGPTENWKVFVNAEKQIQLEAGAGQRVDQVINETLSGKKNFTSFMTLTTDEALSAGQKYLGPEYRENPALGFFTALMARESSVLIQDLHQEYMPQEFRMCILELKIL